MNLSHHSNLEDTTESQSKMLQKHFTTLHVGLNVRKMLTLLWLLLLSVSVIEGKKSPKCSVCKDIVNNFKKGLESTAKSNYGGGNTKWEEKSLGSYATSEVRLVEILEHLCDDAGKECHSVLEEHEELIERFWFKEFAQKKDTDFHAYICIDHMAACCPSNTYGKECQPCPGGVDRPCTGNGQCQGEGTREGSGKCQCQSGYTGELCDQCKDGYFEESKNETHTSCKVCHISCKDTCSEGGPKGCDECKSGWEEKEDVGCQDINECSEDPCEENQYCTNTQGSFSCFTCNEACSSCTGSGPGKCIVCNVGFTINADGNMCVDNNECEQDSSLCTGENEFCKNIPGSYQCACKAGFHREGDACIPIPKKVIKTEKLPQPPNLKEQLQKKLKKNDIDWSKFKDLPSVITHFLIMGFYGVSCKFASSSHLAMGALSVLMVVHVLWFAASSDVII